MSSKRNALDHLGTTDTVEFVRQFAGARKSVLDVGCGDGAIARALTDSGFEVVAIDGNESAVAEAKSSGVNARHGDFITWADDRKYDLILFARSLHHMHPLDKAIAKIGQLLSPDGLLLVDEFCPEIVDLKTALWFYGIKSLLEPEDAPEKGHRHGHGPRLESGAIPADPVAAWRDHHFGRHEVIDAATLMSALRAEFAIRSEERLPYLYRYFVGVMPHDQGQRLFDWESRLCESGLIERVGLRVVAGRRD